MNDELLGVEELMAADGFINFYSVLDITSATPPEEIQESINVLYQEAQTNRDHRVPARRREYQMLLDILPQARTILTDKARRKRYDAYCNAVELQLPRMPYSDFFNDLMREKEAIDTRSDILTVRDLSRLRLSGADAPNPELEPVISDSPLDATPATASVATKIEAESPVKKEEPVAVSTSAPKSAQAPASHFFPLQALSGGGVVFVGLLGSLPTLAGIPVVLSAPLALIGAGVTAFVFSLTAEAVEA